MLRRSSIGRWMLAMSLIGVGLGIVRFSFGPGTEPSEIGPMAIVAVIGLVIGVQAKGQLRRFGFGIAVAGLAVAVGFENTPVMFRRRVYVSVVRPILLQAHKVLPAIDTVYGPVWSQPAPLLAFYGIGLDGHANSFTVLDRRAQIIVGLLELPFALVGGLLTSIRWRRSNSATDSTAMDRP